MKLMVCVLIWFFVNNINVLWLCGKIGSPSDFFQKPNPSLSERLAFYIALSILWPRLWLQDIGKLLLFIFIGLPYEMITDEDFLGIDFSICSYAFLETPLLWLLCKKNELPSQ